MKRGTICVLMAILDSTIGFASCGGSNRGEDINGGEIGATTNALTSSGVVDLFIDEATFDGNIVPHNVLASHPYLEIQVLNSENQLIGCIGATQDPFMNYMGDAIVTYAEIGGQFVFSDGALPVTSEPLTFRLVDKDAGNPGCPEAYIGTTRATDTEPDYILASTETTISDALADGLDFVSYANIYLRRAADAPREVALSEDVAGGQLALDQLRFAEFDTGAGETSNPEISLYVLEYGDLNVTACAELVDVDAGSVLFGTLAYGFVTPAGAAVTLDSIDPAKNYWFFLAERDTGDVCPTDISGNVILAYTGAISGANFLTAPIDFENSYGDFVLYTK